MHDRRLAALAGRQYGVVARAQLAEVGLGRGAIALRLDRGRLHQVHARVYAVGHTVLADEGRWMAAVLAGGPGAVLSHRSAAAHWGIWQSRRGRVEVTRAVQRRPSAGLRFYRFRLPTDEVTVHERIPVTTVPRTLFDLAAVVSPGQLARAVKEAEVRRLYDSLSLADLLERHPRRPGAPALRAAIGDDAAPTRSDFEDLFLLLAASAGMRRPETNAALWIGDRGVEPDFMWRDERVIVELDGAATHYTRAAYEDDRARDRALTAAGWRVIRITWRQLRDEPETVVRDLRAALALGRAARR